MNDITDNITDKIVSPLPTQHRLVLTTSPIDRVDTVDTRASCETSEEPVQPIRYHFCRKFQTLEDVYRYSGLTFSDIMVSDEVRATVPDDVMQYLRSRVRTVMQRRIQ